MPAFGLGTRLGPRFFTQATPQPWSPMDLGGLVLWTDMQDPQAFTLDSGRRVVQMVNKATGVVWPSPTMRALLSYGLNGRSCAEWEAGSNARYYSTEAPVVASQLNNSPCTVFAVAQSYQTDFTGTVFGAGAVGTGSIRTKRYGWNTTGTGIYVASAADDAGVTTNLNSSAGVTDLDPHVLAWSISPTLGSILVDGQFVANPAAYAPGTTTVDQAAIGCRPDLSPDSFFNGLLGEVLVFNRQLSDVEVQRVVLWLKTRWAVDLSPSTILGSSLQQWCRADQGVTLDVGVSQWGDLSGNARYYEQATTTAQPAWGATAGPNGTPAITGDGVDDNLRALDLDRPVPGTTPTWMWIVLKQNSWSSTRRIYSNGNSSSTLCLVQTSPSPGLATYNAVNSAIDYGLPVGVWGAVTTYFSNSPADYLQVNDNAPTGGFSLGNNGPGTSFTLFSGNNSLYSNVSIAEFVVADALPSPEQIAALAVYRRERYGF